MFENFIVEFVKPHRRAAVAFTLILFFVALIGFTTLLLLVRHQDPGFDIWLVQTIQQINYSWFKDLMILVSAVGNGFYLAAPFSLFLFWLVRRGNRGEALLLPTIFLAPLVSEVTKAVVGRDRPAESLVNVAGDFPGFSFPSGHVLAYTLFFGLVAFFALSLPKVNPFVRWSLFIFSGLMVISVGVSRIYLGAHWPTDVAAGYLIGLAFLEVLIVIYLRQIYLPKVRQKEHQTNNRGEN